MAKDTWNRITGKDIYNGVGVNCYTGLGLTQNMNIWDEPGIAMVNREATLELPGDSIESTCDGTASTDYITITGTTLNYPTTLAGSARAIKFSATTIGGTDTSTIYFCKYISTDTWELYTDYDLNNQVDITSDGSGTFDTIDIGYIRGIYQDEANNRYFFSDNNSRVWHYPGYGNSTGAPPELLQGNSTGGSSQTDVVFWKGYLFFFHINSSRIYIDVCDVDGTNAGNITATDWTNSWFTGGITNPTYVQAIVGQDDTIYFTNGEYIGSIIETSGDTFDPSDSASYTQNGTALQLPDGYKSQKLEELGQKLMIATNDGRVYPWDRVSDQVDFPIQYASTVTQMINANNLLYTFHSSNNSIYVADTVNSKIIAKIPEYLTNRFSSAEQLVFGSNIVRYQDSLLFGISKGDEISMVWSLNLQNNALAPVTKISTDSTGTAFDWVYIDALGALNPADVQGSVKIFWRDQAETPQYGMDNYQLSNGEGWTGSFGAFITTPLVTIGDAFNKGTLKELEVEFVAPLKNTAAEGVKLAYRTNITDDFTDLQTEYGSGQFEGKTVYNFKLGSISATQVQFRIYTQSSNTTGATRCKIKEIRWR